MLLSKPRAPFSSETSYIFHGRLSLAINSVRGAGKDRSLSDRGRRVVLLVFRNVTAVAATGLLLPTSTIQRSTCCNKGFILFVALNQVKSQIGRAGKDVGWVGDCFDGDSWVNDWIRNSINGLGMKLTLYRVVGQKQQVAFLEDE